MDDQPTLLEEVVEQLPALTGAMRTMIETVEILTNRVDEHQERIRHNLQLYRRALAVVTIGLILDLSLTIFGAFLYLGERDNSDRLQSVQDRTSLSVLCPLYEVFVESLKANPSPANTTPDQVKLRLDAAAAITQGINNLRCS